MQVKTKTIVLMGRTYNVRCPVDKEDILQKTVQILAERLTETQRNAGLTAREDIIMMTALNLCHEQMEQSESSDNNDMTSAQEEDLVAQQNRTD